jgi:putative secretion ATPase (PEP-CTERM system associated)
MYESFYGFSERPFQLNPDPRFYFESAHQGEGFVVITGEVGAGKTMLVRNVMANVDSEKVVAAHLVSTQLDAEDLLRMVAAGFGVRAKELAKPELLLSLESALVSHASQGRKCLLIVDEAQNLTPRAVEELRMLSNFQAGTQTLLQIFLVGQPEFRQGLQSPQLYPLRQRVIAACHIGPMDADDTRKYIEHRLERAGAKDVALFTRDALEAIFAASGGIPRCINLVCDRVLLSGFLTDKRVLPADIVNEIAQEIHGETLLPAAMNRRNADRARDRA